MNIKNPEFIGYSISHIAQLIYDDWDKVSVNAHPYLQAMLEISSLEDKIGYDTGYSSVCYFLANSSQWKGEVAREVKKELRRRKKQYEQNHNMNY